MSEELSREIRKLEVRLGDLLKEEDGFIRELEGCIGKFKELEKGLEKLKAKPGSISPPKVKELMKLQMETIRAFSETLRRESRVEHERSHLLESYGALLLTLEEEIQRLRYPSPK